MKEYNFNNLPGCVEQRRNRKTGLLISLYRADQSDLDDTEGQWVTLCEEHGNLVNHETLMLAKEHMTDPSMWCADCQEIKKETVTETLERIVRRVEKGY